MAPPGVAGQQWLISVGRQRPTAGLVPTQWPPRRAVLCGVTTFSFPCLPPTAGVPRTRDLGRSQLFPGRKEISGRTREGGTRCPGTGRAHGAARSLRSPARSAGRSRSPGPRLPSERLDLQPLFMKDGPPQRAPHTWLGSSTLDAPCSAESAAENQRR